MVPVLGDAEGQQRTFTEQVTAPTGGNVLQVVRIAAAIVEAAAVLTHIYPLHGFTGANQAFRGDLFNNLLTCCIAVQPTQIVRDKVDAVSQIYARGN